MHPNIVPAKKCSAKKYTCKILEKNQALNRLKKSNFHLVPYQKQKKNVFSIRTKNYSGNKKTLRRGIEPRTPP